jgi:deaminated glutathione amidase
MRLALAQLCSGIDVHANARVLHAHIAEAKKQGAEIIFTPEMSNIIDSNRVRAARSIVAQEQNYVLQTVQEAALTNSIWVALGSCAVKHEDGAHFANRSFLINPAGEIVAQYDKMHLFDVDLPSGESWRESNAYKAGVAPVLAATPWGGLGLSICYDLRFPALFAALSGGGARLLAVPAAFTVSTGKAHWETLLRARAIENACFVVAAAQCGTHEDGRETYGHSLLVSPLGEVLLDMKQEQGVRVIDIDLAEVERVRGRIPVLAHRREIKPL